MRYEIAGFSQRVLCELGLDIQDAYLIRWFSDFVHTGKMKALHRDGDTVYYYVKYQAIIDDLPILGVTNKRAIARRLDKICGANVLSSHLIKNGSGTWSCYAINHEGFSMLVGDDTVVGTQKYNPLDSKVQPPLDSKVQPNYSSTSLYSSTKFSSGSSPRSDEQEEPELMPTDKVKPASKQKKKPSDTVYIEQQYFLNYKNFTNGKTPVYSYKAGRAIISRVLSSITKEEAIKLLDFALKDDFITSRGYDIKTIFSASVINRLQAEMAKRDSLPKSTWTPFSS